MFGLEILSRYYIQNTDHIRLSLAAPSPRLFCCFFLCSVSIQQHKLGISMLDMCRAIFTLGEIADCLLALHRHHRLEWCIRLLRVFVVMEGASTMMVRVGLVPHRGPTCTSVTAECGVTVVVTWTGHDQGITVTNHTASGHHRYTIILTRDELDQWWVEIRHLSVT